MLGTATVVLVLTLLTRSHELFTSDGWILMDPHDSLILHMATLGRDAATFSETRHTRHGDPVSLDTQITSSCHFFGLEGPQDRL